MTGREGKHIITILIESGQNVADIIFLCASSLSKGYGECKFYFTIAICVYI